MPAWGTFKFCFVKLSRIFLPHPQKSRPLCGCICRGGNTRMWRPAKSNHMGCLGGSPKAEPERRMPFGWETRQTRGPGEGRGSTKENHDARFFCFVLFWGSHGGRWLGLSFAGAPPNALKHFSHWGKGPWGIYQWIPVSPKLKALLENTPSGLSGWAAGLRPWRNALGSEEERQSRHHGQPSWRPAQRTEERVLARHQDCPASRPWGSGWREWMEPAPSCPQ